MGNDQSSACKIEGEPVKCKTEIHQNVEWKQGQKLTVKLENLVNFKVVPRKLNFLDKTSLKCRM